MTDSLGDLLLKKVDDLDLGRQGELAVIQKELDRLFPHLSTASKIDYDRSLLTIEATSSSAASILRFGQVQILSAIKRLTRQPIKSLHIRIK